MLRRPVLVFGYRREMRIAVALVAVTSGVAHADRPPTSAIAAVDNLLEDLELGRYDAAMKALAPTVTLRNLEFRGACKKSFPKRKAAVLGRSTSLAKCLAGLPFTEKMLRIAASDKKTSDGWLVWFTDDQLVYGVRTRGKTDYEVVSVALPDGTDLGKAPSKP